MLDEIGNAVLYLLKNDKLKISDVLLSDIPYSMRKSIIINYTNYLKNGEIQE